MSDAELSLSYELLELIRLRVGDEGLKKFINDFADYCNAILDDDDEDYIEVEDPYDTDSNEDEGVTEQYTTEVDKEGFHSLKECDIEKK